MLPNLASHSPLLGGKGNFELIYADFPRVTIPLPVKLYYLLDLAYHVENTFQHFYNRPKNDFFEMILHHFSSITLIVFSYIWGHTSVGVHVLMIMDNADFFVGLVRVLMDWAPSLLSFSVYIMIMLSWGYF